MAADNQEEVKSVGKGKQKSDVVLSACRESELEIPENEDYMNTEDQRIGVNLHVVDQMKKCSGNDVERVCHVCSKVFTSGKALGGHMRIHIRLFKKELPIKTDDFSSASSQVFKKPVCRVCGKYFPSMKSLFGHMRCHPERGWRGIHPPTLVTKGTSSSSSLSYPSEVDDGHMEIQSSVGRNSRAVDLAASLKGWTVTAKRGRKAMAASSSSVLSTSEDDQLYNAVNHLMMLTRGNPVEVTPKGQKFRESDDAAGNICSEGIDPVFRSKEPMTDGLVNGVDQGGSGGESVNTRVESNECLGDHDATTQLNDKSLQVIKKERRKKKRCLGRLLQAAAPSRLLDFDLNEMPTDEQNESRF